MLANDGRLLNRRLIREDQTLIKLPFNL